jgi:hypothetical protein
MLGLGQIVIATCDKIRSGIVGSHFAKPFAGEHPTAQRALPFPRSHKGRSDHRNLYCANEVTWPAAILPASRRRSQCETANSFGQQWQRRR